MKGSVFKRCTRCGRRVKRRSCEMCGSSAYRWAFVVDVGRDAEGKRMQQPRSGFASKAEADRALQELLSSLNDGTFVQRSDMTVADFLLETWMPATAPPRVVRDVVRPRAQHQELRPTEDWRRRFPRAQRRAPQPALRGVAAIGTDDDGGRAVADIGAAHPRDAAQGVPRCRALGPDPSGATAQADPPPARLVRAARKVSMSTWTRRTTVGASHGLR